MRILAFPQHVTSRFGFQFHLNYTKQTCCSAIASYQGEAIVLLVHLHKTSFTSQERLQERLRLATVVLQRTYTKEFH